jgi:hypothetical protein
MKALIKFTICELILTSMQCKKTTSIVDTPSQPDGLPPETQEGKNTIGCFWNDTLWLPSVYVGIPAVDCSYHNDSNWTFIAIDYSLRKETFSFNLASISLGNKVYFDKYPNTLRISKNSPTFAQYSCGTINGLIINITKFIKPNKISTPNTKGVLSGNFSGKFYRLLPGGIDIYTNDVIIIKKAVFDLQVK